jgi:hypothetical protein
MIVDDLASASSYTPEGLHRIRTACLTVASVLGDLMDEEITVVGGLVPSLLIDQRNLPEGADAHPGTMDLDLALQLAVLERQGYKAIAERLRGAGFEPDRNAVGNTTVQRWIVGIGDHDRVTVDFLIPQVGPDVRKGIFHLEGDFGALISPGLDLAFHDRVIHRLEGSNSWGDRIERDVWVCGPGALVVLKALACRGREKPKDAFDLYYVLRNFGNGPSDVAGRLRPLVDDRAVREARQILASDFADESRSGPRRVARFLGMEGDADLLSQVVALVGDFLDALNREDRP